MSVDEPKPDFPEAAGRPHGKHRRKGAVGNKTLRVRGVKKWGFRAKVLESEGYFGPNYCTLNGVRDLKPYF